MTNEGKIVLIIRRLGDGFMGQNEKTSDKIILKAEKKHWLDLLSGPIFCLVFGGGMIWAMIYGAQEGEREPLIYVIMVLVIPLIAIWLVHFSLKALPLSRQIVMSADGCTISLLMSKKTIRWDEFAVIREYSWERLEYVSRHRVDRIEDNGIVFSTEYVKKCKPDKKIIRSRRYLNNFYVTYRMGAPFEVDRDEILLCLRKWGVSLQESNY